MFWQSIWDLQFAKHRIKFSILSSLSQRNLIVSVVFLNFVFDVLSFSPFLPSVFDTSCITPHSAWLLLFPLPVSQRGRRILATQSGLGFHCDYMQNFSPFGRAENPSWGGADRAGNFSPGWNFLHVIESSFLLAIIKESGLKFQPSISARAEIFHVIEPLDVSFPIVYPRSKQSYTSHILESRDVWEEPEKSSIGQILYRPGTNLELIDNIGKCDICASSSNSQGKESLISHEIKLRQTFSH